MRGLEDKTVIVTGSGRGIGQAIAQRLAQEGAFVAVNDVDEENTRETVELIEDDGGAAMTAVADVTDLTAVRDMVKQVVDAQGQVDVHVNNAGWDRIEWFVNQDPDIWDRIIDINLRGQMNCSRVVAEHFVENDVEGPIVDIASDAARVGSSGEAVYSACKGGIVAFTKTLAREAARSGITANAVCPGPADTPLFDQISADNPKLRTALEKAIPLRRLAQPEDLANAVAFLASPASHYITGQTLSVSGGLTMA